MTRNMGGLVLVVVLALGCAPCLVRAQDKSTTARQDRKSPGAKARAKPAAGKTKGTTPAQSQTPKTDGAAPEFQAADSKAARKPAPSAEADEAVRKEGTTEVKVLEFTGLDIEGQLKTPQMLYFLRRLRAEFGQPHLPHRSFLPELEQTTKDEAF